MKLKKKFICLMSLAFIIMAGTVTIVYASFREEKEEETSTAEDDRDIIRTVYTKEYQDSVSERLEYAKSTGNYTEDSMLIEPNPYGTNTQSLYVYFRTEEPAAVSYTVSVSDEDIPDFSAVPVQESGYLTDHEFQVIGLIPDRRNTITFTVRTENGEEKTYTHNHRMGSLTGEEEVQLEQAVQAGHTEVTDGLYAILGNDSDGLDFMYYYDNYGVLRGEIPLIGYRSHNLLFQDGLMYFSISQTKMAAMNTLGKVEQIYDTGQYILHHDYVFDDNGNLLILATDTESSSVQDLVIRLNTQTGDVDCVLDLGQLFGSYKDTCTETSEGELDWMHINTIQWMGDETILLSSRETSTILKIADLYTGPQVEYMIGEESFWEGTEYEELLLSKVEHEARFSSTGGQHTVTYAPDDSLPEGQYYLYMFNNNLGVSQSREEYDWSQIPGIETSASEGIASYFYKYKVDETVGTYALEQSFEVPFSPYVSSAQEYGGNIIIDSGMKGSFGEYDSEGGLLQQFEMTLADGFIYRVYKYDFKGFYFAG